jgi:hypothetical protein
LKDKLRDHGIRRSIELIQGDEEPFIRMFTRHREKVVCELPLSVFRGILDRLEDGHTVLHFVDFLHDVLDASDSK